MKEMPNFLDKEEQQRKLKERRDKIKQVSERFKILSEIEKKKQNEKKPG